MNTGALRMVLLALVCLLWLWPGAPVTAQSLMPTLGSQAEPETEPDFGRIVEQAAEQGVSVIVIDTDGNVISSVASTEQAEQSASADQAASGLMDVQKDANAFRSALFERLRELPAAVNEVLFILRASSPDGTITAFAKVIIYSLILFAIGMVAERGERVLGFMIYELHKTRLHLLNFAVANDARRRGVGSQMVDKLIGKLSSQRRTRPLGLSVS